MNSFYYRDKWNQLLKGTVNADELRSLARQIAYSFLDYYLKDCRYEKEYIDLLCEMTTFSDDPELTNPGTHALFNIIIESLCDDFEELQTETYNRVMTQIISYCRSIPAGRELNNRLKDFNIYSPDDLLERTRKIRSDSKSLSQKKCIRKILLLSRVTIGADIAITSVIIQRLGRIFPDARMILLGNKKLEEVYGEHPDIQIREMPYSRRGGLLERFASWHTVLKIIAEETASLPAEESILVDPDSRLSQLGVLPLVPPDNYYFFDSRSASSFNSKMSMVELTNSWLDRVTGEQYFCYPCVWIRQHYLDTAAAFCSLLRARGAKKIITVNFGVGGNTRKRLSRSLEEKLLLALLQEPDTLILLDKGAGDEELSYINSLIDKVQTQGYRTAHTHPGADNVENIKHGLIGIQSSIGEMASFIAESDEFIGYDSACQHIAAALETPCITIFAGSNNMRFIRRWSAHGKKGGNIVHIDTLNDPSLIDIDDIISRIMHLRELHSECSQE
jgi:ADP-heptose:LPS heptosyltransferase